MRISSSTPLGHGRRCGAFAAKKDREFFSQTARDAPVALVFEVLRFSVLTTSFALFRLSGIASREAFCGWHLAIAKRALFTTLVAPSKCMIWLSVLAGETLQR